LAPAQRRLLAASGPQGARRAAARAALVRRRSVRVGYGGGAWEAGERAAEAVLKKTRARLTARGRPQVEGRVILPGGSPAGRASFPRNLRGEHSQANTMPAQAPAERRVREAGGFEVRP
jgi:hypothetical protein